MSIHTRKAYIDPDKEGMDTLALAIDALEKAQRLLPDELGNQWRTLAAAANNIRMVARDWDDHTYDRDN